MCATPTSSVISITKMANRVAGYWCGAFLIFFGILSKVSGVFLAIPASVLGGVTTFLFSTVCVSGLRVISLCGFSRRDRVILAAALSLGMGNLLVPSWSSYIFTYEGDNHALTGFLDSIIIILETPFLIGGLIATLLNCTLPADPVDIPHQHDREDEEDVEMGRGSDDSKGNKSE